MNIKHLLPCLLLSALLPGAPVPAAPADAPLPPPAESAWDKVRDPADNFSLSQQADREEAAGHYKAAAKICRTMYETADTADGRAFALQKEADNLFLAGKYFKAQESYKKLLESYSARIRLKPVLERQRVLADYLASGKASVLNFKNVELAAEVYETILQVAPAGANAPQDMLKLAQYRHDLEHDGEAVTTYRDLAKRFPASPEAARARVEIARIFLAQSRHGDGDGLYLRQARQELERMLATPAAATDPQLAETARNMLGEIRTLQAKNQLELGKFYLRKYSYRPATARRYFYDVKRNYPETAAAGQADVLLARMEPAPAGATPGEGAGGTAAATPGGKEAIPEPPPQPVRLLKQQETVDKWLLPMEDYSDYLRKK